MKPYVSLTSAVFPASPIAPASVAFLRDSPAQSLTGTPPPIATPASRHPVSRFTSRPLCRFLFLLGIFLSFSWIDPSSCTAVALAASTEGTESTADGTPANASAVPHETTTAATTAAAPNRASTALPTPDANGLINADNLPPDMEVPLEPAPALTANTAPDATRVASSASSAGHWRVTEDRANDLSTPSLPPSLSSSRTARQGSTAPYRSPYRVQSAPTIRATIPTGKTTMVSAQGERLISAIFDNREVEVQSQSTSGRLFVLPLVEGPVSLFVTTESGETLPLELTASSQASAKNIVLERNVAPQNPWDSVNTAGAPMRRAPARVLATGDYVGTLKAELLALVTRDSSVVDVLNESLSPEVAGILMQLKRSSPLKPIHVTLLGNDAFTGTVVRCRHGGLKPIVIEPQAWTRGMIEASAVSAQYIKPGEEVELYFLERR